MEQMIHSLDFFGVLIESFAIMFSWKKIFTQITIATIFPLAILSLCHAQFSHLLFPITETGSFNTTWDSLWSEELAFWILKIVYVVFFLVLSLISTSLVVYAVASVYTSKEVGFGEVISIVPKVWKRLMVTFGWSFLLVFLYNMVAFSLLRPFSGSETGRITISGPIFMIYVLGFVYISIIWHLASVVSVLEEDCGVGAMVKSKRLVKGKMVISVGVFLMLNLCFVLIQVLFHRFVVVGEVFWSRVWWGLGCLLLLSGFTLLGLVVQTVVYFVCKMYHIERMDVLQNHHKFGDYYDLLRFNELDQC